MSLYDNMQKNKYYTMIKNNDFSYSEGGVTIIFSELPEFEEKDGYYEFKVVGDPEMTKKLRASVKNKTVKKNSIFYCAQALFQIIESGKFEEVVTEERRRQAFNSYEEKTGKRPLFVKKRLSTHPPLSKVKLAHDITGLVIEFEARNVITAETLAVEKYLEELAKISS